MERLERRSFTHLQVKLLPSVTETSSFPAGRKTAWTGPLAGHARTHARRHAPREDEWVLED